MEKMAKNKSIFGSLGERKNTKEFIIKGVILVAIFLGVTFLFRFPIDYFHLTLLRMTEATRVFSKSDGLKVFALAGMFFTLYYQRRINNIAHPKQDIPKTVIFGILGFLLVTAYYGLRFISNAYEITSGPSFYAVYASSILVLVIAFGSFLLATFSFDYLKRFYSEFRKELWITAIAAVICYNLLMFFQNQWRLFSATITNILAFLFQPLFPTSYSLIGEAPLLQVSNFTVSIGPPCSGIESMFLFVAFSVGIFALDHAKMRKLPYLGASLLGFVGVYFVNILRLFLLMLTGIYVSPEFAVGLFHTNIGWLLFVIYFLCYYLVMKRFIYYASSTKPGAQTTEKAQTESARNSQEKTGKSTAETTQKGKRPKKRRR
ncbi:exosortase/archaeosortase family protein [Candidatus Woesearchaeota archaeon]|nr:exosortase/archaeosortase family protein [Candidatus Woesearchaeota archaeon]